MDTYTALQTEIAAWLDREDLAARIPTFVRLAEARFNRELRHHKMIARETATLAGEYLALPSGFREALRVQLEGEPPLAYLTPEQADEVRPELTGTPAFYTIVGGLIEFVPAATSGTVELAYYRELEPLATAPGGVNWLLAESPDLYLYGSLVAAAAFLQHDERVPLWESATAKLIADINASSQTAVHSGSTLVARPKR